VNGSFDFVIGSGALTRAVLSDEVAKKVFAQVSNMINPGGYIILTGAEYSWIDAAMMRNKGFHVLNTFCPQIGKQLYVAQKPKLSFL
jgi:hypothetical protein